MNLLPNSAWYPLYPPGSSGSRSGHPAVRGVTDGRTLRAVHGQAHVVGLGLVRQLGVLGLLGLGRVGAEHVGYVGQGVLQFGVGRGDRAEVTARPGVGHPWRRGVLALRGDQRVVLVADRGAGRGVVVDDRVGPVGERPGGVGGPARRVVVVLVRDRYALVAAVQAGLGGHDVVGRVRDQRGVLMGDQRPVAGDEVEQVRHLLQVAGHVRLVPGVVHVVELDVDDVLDRRSVGAEGARGRWTPCARETASAGAADAAPPAGPASMPRTRVPPPATATSPAAHAGNGNSPGARPQDPAGPFISLVAPMGGYLQRHRNTSVPRRGTAAGDALSMGAKESQALAREQAGQDDDKTGRIPAGGTTRRRSGRGMTQRQPPYPQRAPDRCRAGEKTDAYVRCIIT